MANLDPELMGTFRRKMKNPRHFHQVCGILCSKRCEDLRHHGRCCGMIDELSRCLNVPVTPYQRENAAQWLMTCGVDPQNRYHRKQMWNMVWGRR
ncbi:MULTISPECIES: hypothetical protein [unclassified Paenibacillus]|uniref:Uncharacterized protein n=1 Tax=Paenibacillus provencensis TaxID=441151 RepID=A0ABW3PWS2_9BACL|nr:MULTISPECIES: hypothetical protein [unclassified Paenibacillus]SFS82391.1 hypothetical protein SAMN04488601_104113 [Paenibacillus sp. 453mf]